MNRHWHGRILLAAVLFCLAPALRAQFQTIAQSDAFDEPENGAAKLLFLRNGNTLLAINGSREGLHLMVYDDKHKLKVDRSDVMGNGKDFEKIEALFECGDQLVVFSNRMTRKSQVLTRYLIDERSGNVRKHDQLAELDQLSARESLRMADRTEFPQFLVRKDPASDHYAVGIFNPSAPSAKKLEVVYYGPDHKELARGFFKNPNDNFEHMQLLDLSVLGDQKVCMFVYTYNKARHGLRDGDLAMASLTPGSGDISLIELNFPKELSAKSAQAHFNPVSRNIVLLTDCLTGTGRDRGYVPVMAFIDPFENELRNAFPVAPTRAEGASQLLFGKKNHYTGIPQDFSINADGSIFVIFQEVTITATSRQVYTDLGDIGIAQLNANGQETGGYFLPVDHVIEERAIRDFYYAERTRGMQELFRGNQYKSFSYLHGRSKSYLLMNDVEHSEKQNERGKKTRILAVSSCDAQYFPLEGDDPLLKHNLLFGEGTGRFDHNLAVFTVSDYDREQNVYATLKLEREGHSKQVRVIWLQPG